MLTHSHATNTELRLKSHSYQTLGELQLLTTGDGDVWINLKQTNIYATK